MKCRLKFRQITPRNLGLRVSNKLRSTDEKVITVRLHTSGTEVFEETIDPGRFSLSGMPVRLKTEVKQNSKYSSYLLHPMYQNLTDYQA